MKLDGVYYPLNESISWLTTCMEEMKQDIARIQNATDAARPPSIDKRQPQSIDSHHSPSIDIHHHTSIDNHFAASIDVNPPRPHTMKSQPDFHTREEIDQLVEGIYRALETTKERLDGRCDDIYFPMDLTISELTSKVEVIQGNWWKFRSRLVPKTTSDTSNTPYHVKEISADTCAALTRHQFNLESLGQRLQRIENTAAAMKDKWRRGNEAMRDFTGGEGREAARRRFRGRKSNEFRRFTLVSIDTNHRASIDIHPSRSIDRCTIESIDNAYGVNHVLQCREDSISRGVRSKTPTSAQP
ncbi:hypothetical protein F2Q70_00010574 [Brassica cretica]|uniref:Uncharacterized protein n=1 Tax=Brassica cretica TaxID=69181 RepID=A0A8S9M0E5_BRACR|nr:hypothetical protein F2Q70_00010574 [Brassica cretica]